MVLLLVGQYAFGQLSPGDLAQAHAHLEGLSNCTQCHEIGNKVTNQKCLACHKEIKSLIRKKKGYHASKEVKNKNCFQCHNDHHGRSFKLVKFDEDKFDHDLAGYKLKGEHKKIDCKECHKPDNIKEKKYKEKRKTFLGMGTKCLACHDDYHQKTLSKDCAKCHNETKFDPAKKFDHDDADYKLTGKHIDVDCIKCHKKKKRNGLDFQVFADIKFNDCNACHDDPHNKHLPGKCTQCHVDQSFTKFVGRRKFNHNKTTFKLRGKHKNVSCFNCHAKRKPAKTIFQDKAGVVENQCVKCHDDVHGGKFGTDCTKCHTVNGFSSKKSLKNFNHDQADFHIEGKHEGVDCKKCHVGKLTDPINFSKCSNCHDDFHQGDFKKNGRSPDCAQCHSLQEGFEYSLYSIEDHQKSDFPLKGAHEATPCFACHVSEEKWSFKDIGVTCNDCHTDIHDGYIDKKYYPKKNCDACHSSENWLTSGFNHDELTDWPLKGKHKEVSCRSCHFTFPKGKKEYIQQFRDLETKCFNCHDDEHAGQFEEKGITDCQKCHTPEAWDDMDFDHDKTKFPLEGKHKKIECKACHQPEKSNGKLVVVYKTGKTECIDCHR